MPITNICSLDGYECDGLELMRDHAIAAHGSFDAGAVGHRFTPQAIAQGHRLRRIVHCRSCAIPMELSGADTRTACASCEAAE